MGSKQRESPHTSTSLVDRRDRTCVKIRPYDRECRFDHAGDAASVQPFDAQAQDAWLGRLRECEQHVEVCVERDDDTSIGDRAFEDLLVCRARHSDVADVDDVVTAALKDSNGAAR